jgi:hypothetical protein
MFEPGNFASILELLYSSGKPFKFLAVNCPSSVVEGRWSVRFFLQLENGDLAEHVASALRTSMDVEVVEDSQPPTRKYERCVEFELRNHYALPICQLDEEPHVNPIDEVVGALSEGDAAFEVVAVGDPRARPDIISYIGKKTKRAMGFGETLLNAFLGVLDGFFGGGPKKEGGGRVQLNPVTKARVEAAGKKANQNLFSCSVRAYGDRKVLETVEGVLPFSPMNKLKARRTVKATEAQELRRPSRYVLHNMLSNLSWIVPALTIFSTLYFGVFDPLRLANVDILVMAVAVISAIPLLIRFPKRRPLVLCMDELSLTVGMPTAVGRLPVEFGSAPITRRQFIFGRGEEAEAPAQPTQPAQTPSAAPTIHPSKTQTAIREPVKVVGVLRDPRTGLPLQRRGFDVYVDGVLLQKGVSDEQGGFEVVYVPEHVGAVTVEVRPEGYAAPGQTVKVLVSPQPEGALPPGVRRCPACHAVVPEGAECCLKCGSKLESVFT